MTSSAWEEVAHRTSIEQPYARLIVNRKGVNAMNKEKAKMSLSVPLVVLVALVAISPALAGGNPSATGGGTALEFGALSTFTFNAIEHKDGTVKGNLVSHLRFVDGTIHMDIDCLNITGNTATLSGTVTKVKGKDPPPPWIFVGQNGVFQVEDNGEGGNAPPDLFSDVLLRDGVSCESDFPTPYIPISGNIQVKS